MDERRVTIRDIADELGLSTATVSNVLHGKPGKASEETVRRVHALLEERRYIPSMAGILLARNPSRIVGVVVNNHEKYEGRSLEDAFIAASLSALAREIERSGRFMMLRQTGQTEEIIRLASMWNLEALVLIGFCEQDYLRLRSHMRIPFVLYDGYVAHAQRICNVVIDHYDGGRQAGEYLRRMGHTRALCVADNAICMDDERYRGFVAGFGDAPRMIVPMRREQRRAFYDAHIGEIRGYTAVFAASDVYAAELMCALAAHGVRVPEDISVIGFDGTPLCELLTPTLTSVRQDVALRASVALKALLALAEGREAPEKIVLPVTLIERESVKRI